jgi:hypothetical protein
VSLLKVEVKGVVLVGVSVSREVVPTFARVLLHTSLGRHMLRPLLRSEIIQVANRRAWYDASKLTPDVLDLYKVTFKVQLFCLDIISMILFEIASKLVHMLECRHHCGWKDGIRHLQKLASYP